MPREKTMLNAIFLDERSCKFQITGNGSISIQRSVKMVGIETAMVKILALRQWPFG